MDSVKVGLIGSGSRGAGMANLLCNQDKRVKVKAVFDPDKERCKEFNEISKQDAKICDSYQELLADPEISWVMVMSPNCHHKEQVVASFKAGKNVFAEKPLATTIKDCQAIHDAHKRSGLLFATGFVLRYAPLYNKVRELLDSGEYGNIISIDANENVAPDHGGYIMRNWRRFTKLSGPHILEKCCHDIDLLNWFAGSLPSRVASFGGRDFFIPENARLKEKYKDRKPEDKPLFYSWRDPHGADCPFASDKDIIDNQIAIMEYRNNVRVMFQATLCNAIPERRMYMNCSEGNIVAELYSGIVKARRIGRLNEEKTFDCRGDFHGGGDSRIMQSLVNSMFTGEEPKCSGDEGLEGSVVALAIDEARVKGRIIDMERIWKRLDR